TGEFFIGRLVNITLPPKIPLPKQLAKGSSNLDRNRPLNLYVATLIQCKNVLSKVLHLRCRISLGNVFSKLIIGKLNGINSKQQLKLFLPYIGANLLITLLR